MKYFYLDVDYSPVRIDERWLRSLETDGIISPHGRILPPHVGRPLDVVIRDEPFGYWAGGTVAGVFRREFMQAIGDYLQDQVLGRVLMSQRDGPTVVCDDYVSCYTPVEAAVTVRGNRASQWNVLDDGQVEYSPRGAQYVIEPQARDRDVLQDGQDAGLVISSRLRDSIAWDSLPGIPFFSIGLRAKADDGACLPGDPGWNAT